ncbi:TetR family transcriptional regulator [Pseudonocardia sediminis]|uniref:TetR family transcriptional regulator n=2 Tax=Pseudonocardia sediminis TaxID=1397368 RepID=A0A4Q7UXN5_PSEST|nr:TetR family transcriptional regulator [Pseudonocardia sediminis]
MGQSSEDPSSARPARRRPTRAQTRQKVLDAALEVFGELGIQGGSLDAVAEAGQLSKGAIYSNFASKTELVLALVQENTLNRVGLGLEAVSHADGPVDALTMLSAAMTRALKGDQVRHRLVAELYILAHRDPQLAEALKVSRAEARAMGAETLRQGAALLGITLPMPAEHLIVVLIGLHNGLAMEYGIDDGSVPDDLFASVLVPTVLR